MEEMCPTPKRTWLPATVKSSKHMMVSSSSPPPLCHLYHDGHVKRVGEIVWTNERSCRGVAGPGGDLKEGWFSENRKRYFHKSAETINAICITHIVSDGAFYLRDMVPLLRGWTMTGRMVKPSLKASGFHLANIWEPMFKDLKKGKVKAIDKAQIIGSTFCKQVQHQHQE